MREENAIEVKDLKKQFKVYYDKGSQLKEKMLFWKRNRYENRQVLNGISFEVKKGEAVGLIGHNGCGKSTTLKLLTKIIYPDLRYCGDAGKGFQSDRAWSRISPGYERKREYLYECRQFSAFPNGRSKRDLIRSLSSRSYRHLSTIRCVPILRECICGWRSQLRSMSMQISF